MTEEDFLELLKQYDEGEVTEMDVVEALVQHGLIVKE